VRKSVNLEKIMRSWNYWENGSFWESYDVIIERREKETFHGADKIADFDYWAKSPYWTADQAAALSFGKNPRHISHFEVEKAAPNLPFRERYLLLFDRISRAQVPPQLAKLILPRDYVTWAKHNDIDLPKALEEAVERHGLALDSSYEEYLLAENERLKEENATLWAQVEKNERADSGSRAPTLAPTSQSGSTKDRNILLKMIIGMAVKKYNYQKESTRQAATQNIADTLAEVGVPVNVDTVRAKLRDAAELLPPDRSERSS